MAKSSCLLVLYLCLNLLLSISATTSELPVSTLIDHPQQSIFLPASTYVQDTRHGWLMGLLTKAFVGDQVNWRSFLPHQVHHQRVVREHRPMPNLQVSTHIIPDCEVDSETRHEGHYLRGMPSRTAYVPAMKTFPCTLLRFPLSNTIAQPSDLDAKPTPSGSQPAPTVPHLQQLSSIIEIRRETPTGLTPPNPTPRLQQPPRIIEAGRPTPDAPIPPNPTPHLQQSASIIKTGRPTPDGRTPAPPTPRLQHPPEDMALQFL